MSTVNKTSELNERQIQVALMREYLSRHHILTIPNSNSLFYHEADLLSVTKARYVHEFEIKISLKDYRHEFKYKPGKHARLSTAYTKKWSRSIPNYFWFVTTFELDEVPSYAGHIVVNSRVVHGRTLTSLHYRRQAPRLHSSKWPQAKIVKVARLLSFRLLKEYQK